MIRVVIDTNVLVSSSSLRVYLQPCSCWLFRVVFSFVYPIQVFTEYQEVIRRPCFKRSPEVIDNTLQSIPRLGHWVEPSAQVAQCSDPDDNMFLDCAEAAEADYLITGNKRHYADRWKKTRMIGARELIELLVKED